MLEQVLVLFLPTLFILLAILMIAGIMFLFRASKLLKNVNESTIIINETLPEVTESLRTTINNVDAAVVEIRENVQTISPAVTEIGRTANSISQVNNLIEDEVVPLVNKVSSILSGVGSIADIVEGFTSGHRED